MNWCCLRNSGGKTGCGRCAAFDLYLAGEAVCVCVWVFVTMIDLLTSLPRDSIPVLLHRLASKQLLCWLMFYGNGSAYVRACTAARVCFSVCVFHSQGLYCS